MEKNIGKKISLLYMLSFISLFVGHCGILESDDTALTDREICPALDVASTQELINNNNTAHLNQLNHKEDVFLFTSSLVKNSFDGQNVIELIFARVEFDFEDEEVDPLDRGGFWARWKIVMIPFDRAVLEEFQNANSPQDLEDLLNLLRNAVNRIEVQLSGPFLRKGCEWGDTDEMGTQTLTYSNYGIYDWDFFPNVDRILGIIYEGDEGVNDDFIAWLDISRNSGTVPVEEAGKYRIVFNAFSNITLRMNEEKS
jgi:hypothetical protein